MYLHPFARRTRIVCDSIFVFRIEKFRIFLSPRNSVSIEAFKRSYYKWRNFPRIFKPRYAWWQCVCHLANCQKHHLQPHHSIDAVHLNLFFNYIDSKIRVCFAFRVSPLRYFSPNNHYITVNIWITWIIIAEGNTIRKRLTKILIWSISVGIFRFVFLSHFFHF